MGVVGRIYFGRILPEGLTLLITGTRLSSIESQSKKVVVAVVVVVVINVGQNWVNNKGYIVVIVFIVLVLLWLLIQKPSFKNWSDSGHYS